MPDPRFFEPFAHDPRVIALGTFEPGLHGSKGDGHQEHPEQYRRSQTAYVAPEPFTIKGHVTRKKAGGLARSIRRRISFVAHGQPVHALPGLSAALLLGIPG